MKYVLVLLLIITGYAVNAQLTGGAVVAEGRDVVPETSFTIEGAHDGWAIMSLSVDRKGNVTSAQLEETNLKSSLDKLEIKKHAMNLKFVSGTHFPQFHQAQVRITMKKSENPPKELEIIID